VIRTIGQLVMFYFGMNMILTLVMFGLANIDRRYRRQFFIKAHEIKEKNLYEKISFWAFQIIFWPLSLSYHMIQEVNEKIKKEYWSGK